MSNSKYITNYKHGGRYTLLYKVWIGMKNRCFNKNAQFYNRYGGRGITVCDEWVNDFACFKNWAESHGYKKGLTIDRENNDGNYTPSNCRFVTMMVQSNNRSNKFIKTVGNVKLTVEDVMNMYRLTYRKAHLKLKRLSGVRSTYIDAVGLLVIKEAVLSGYRPTDVARYFKKTTQNISGHLRKMGVPRQIRGKGLVKKPPQ